MKIFMCIYNKAAIDDTWFRFMFKLALQKIHTKIYRPDQKKILGTAVYKNYNDKRFTELLFSGGELGIKNGEKKN